MFRDLLPTDEDRAGFFESNYQRLPYARPDAIADAASLLTWDGLGDMLGSACVADILVVGDGKLFSRAIARDREELDGLLRVGCSVVVRRAENLDPRLAAIAADLAREMGGVSTVHLFASPEGHHSFGWHYDCEDVFLIQADGQKDMYLRQNTVNPAPTVATMPADMQFEKETTPLQVCTLLPTDCLYIPRGWWHVARCKSPCLTISVGVLSDAARG